MSDNGQSENLPPTGVGWSQVRKWESLVFVSGQVAWDEEGGIVGTSASEQADRAFRNLESALQSAGSSLEQLLKVTIFCRNHEDIPEIRLVRDQWLSVSAPASTLVVVKSLVDPLLLVEVEAVASC